MKAFPKFLKKYFWDTDFKKLNKKTYSQFIIERILEYGDKKAVSWLFKNYPPKEIKDAIYKTRSLSLRSLFFWLPF
jgi:succinate dehydrogenase flavin-adding protein (antitoxin of CptAB toxin-antitoxin module)